MSHRLDCCSFQIDEKAIVWSGTLEFDSRTAIDE